MAGRQTYFKVGIQWKYLYLGVDRLGHTVDCLLTGRPDEGAARRFFERAIEQHELAEKVTLDKIAANTAALEA